MGKNVDDTKLLSKNGPSGRADVGRCADGARPSLTVTFRPCLVSQREAASQQPLSSLPSVVAGSSRDRETVQGRENTI